MTDVLDFLLQHGPLLSYFGIVVALVLTGAGLPIPEEVPIVAAGVLSSPAYGFLDPYAAFGCCLAGALMGDCLMYGIGRFLGKRYLREHPRFAHLLHEEREKQMEDLLERHGLKVFFLARFMVGIRAPIYLAAGVIRVPWKRFVLVDAFCATVVVGLVFGLSYRFGPEINVFVRRYQWTVTGIVVLVVAVVVAIYFIRRKRRNASDPTNDTGAGDERQSETENRHDELHATRIVA